MMPMRLPSRRHTESWHCSESPCLVDGFQSLLQMLLIGDMNHLLSRLNYNAGIIRI